MTKRVNVSFKSNDKDMKLYLEVMQKNDKSCFFKDAARFYLEYRYADITVKNTKEELLKTNSNVSNFINNIMGDD